MKIKTTFSLFIIFLFSSVMLAQEINMNRWIELTVADNSEIYLDYHLTNNETKIKIVCGDTELIQTIKHPSDSFSETLRLTTKGTSVKIYGEIDYFSCLANNENITGIDISNNPELKYLDCRGNNNITALDISKNTKLNELYCGETNNISSLDLSNNTELEILDCSYTEISTLNLSNNINLKKLNCSNTKIDALDLSNNINLKELKCSATKINVLELSKNINLISLDCRYNNIKTLDLSNNTELSYLNVSNNKFTDLNLTNNKNINHINCSNNELTACALDTLYSKLPDRNGEKYPGGIVIDGGYGTSNPGYNKSRISIAEDKNWRVEYYDGQRINNTEFDCNNNL